MKNPEKSQRIVDISAVFIRNPNFKINHKSNGDGTSSIVSMVGERWMISPVTERGIFLGFRTLSNGTVFKKVGRGNAFVSEKTFKVACVSIDGKKNHAYVPIEHMRYAS